MTFLRNLLTKSEFRKWSPYIAQQAREVNLVILSELIMGTGLYIGTTLFIVNLGKPHYGPLIILSGNNLNT